MKKLLLGLFFCASIANASVNWNTVDIIDEFGEKTGAQVIAASGGYFNSFGTISFSKLYVTQQESIFIDLESFIMPEVGKKTVEVAFKIDKNQPIVQYAYVTHDGLNTTLHIESPNKKLLSQLKEGDIAKISIRAFNSNILLIIDIDGLSKALETLQKGDNL